MKIFSILKKEYKCFHQASGKPSINKVMTRLQEFIDECYDEDGNIIVMIIRNVKSSRNVECVRIYNFG